MEILKQDVRGTLSVVGEGMVKARPDVAILDVGVVTENMSARAAVSENAERMERLIGRIKGLGILPEDLQTVGLTVSPIVDYDEKSSTYGKIVRYRVEDTLKMHVDPARAGVALDEAVGAGGNVAGQLSFGLRDDSSQRTAATKLAMQAAMQNAELIASTMKVEIIGVNSIDVSRGGQPVLFGKMLSREGASTPIEAGRLTISAQVNVVYCITKHR